MNTNLSYTESLTAPYAAGVNFLNSLISGRGGSFHQVIVCRFTTPKGQSKYHIGVHGKKMTFMQAAAALEIVEIQARKSAAKEAATIHMTAEVNYCEGHAPSITLKGTRDLHVAGSYDYYGVGAVARGQKGRKEFQGSEVEGPWAYVYGLATCLSSSKELNDREAARKAASLTVKAGDKIWVDGVQYMVAIARGHLYLVD